MNNAMQLKAIIKNMSKSKNISAKNIRFEDICTTIKDILDDIFQTGSRI